MPTSTMDKYCGSTFWNSSLSWYTDDPDLTKCFEKTVLIWIPCIFLWVFSSLDVYYIVSSKSKNIPWNFFNISKLLVNSVLIILSVTDLATAVGYPHTESYEIYNVDIYGPIIKLLSFILTFLFVLYNRKYGIHTSGVLFIFWLLAVVCGTAQFRTEILEARKQPPESYYFHISYWIYYFLVCVMLLLNCFADEAPKITKYPTSQNPCMEESASFLNRIVFKWFDSFAWKGYKKPLEARDLFDLKHEDTAKEIFPNFDKYWQQSLGKAERPPAQYRRTAFKSDAAKVDVVSFKQKKQVSILPALCKTFGPSLLFGALLKFFESILSYSAPLILELLITHVEEKETQWRGLLYVAALFISTTIQTLVLSQYIYCMSMAGVHMRTALTSAVYRKSLQMSNSAKKETSTGKLINLMAVDAQIFVNLLPYIHLVWSAPVEIILALYFLWNLLGSSVLAGVAIMIVLIPFNTAVINRLQLLQVKQVKNKDDRVQLMSEILGGIKVLKLYAWEPSFEQQILKIRGKEVAILKKSVYLYSGMAGVSFLAPYLVALFTFVTFVNISDENVLTPQRAFVSLTLFSKMHFTMAIFPLLLVWVSEAYVSVKRLTKFLNSEQLDSDNVQHDRSQNEPILIKNGNFSWGEEPILKNINVTFEKGGLTAVVGSVGSGKSSLISSLLGEMDRTSGSVNTVGSIAYVSQQAWIQNATLQDNITFGRNMNGRLYNKIIEACALKQDCDMLPAGDQTEIGEKGINVSGGQKQRISLARAIYSNADIYLMDDPLSAVDSHVGKHIFEQVIGPEGLLKNATRVLVTHGVTFLPVVDKIIVLKEGEVSEIGSHQDLLKNKGAFSDFITQHLAEADDKKNNEEDLDKLKKQLGSASVSGRKKRHSFASQSPSDAGSKKANVSLKRRKSYLTLKQRSGFFDSPPEGKDVDGDKLIEDERVETRSVKWSVFMHYFRSIGMTLTIATLVLKVLWQVFVVGNNIWLSVWASDKNATSQQRDLYLGVYGALGFGLVSSFFLSTLALHVGGINGACLLHNSVLHNILRAPCNTFFDVTPIGRILHCFSKDVDTLDNSLPLVVIVWLNCVFSVLSIFFTICYTTPLFMVLIPPIGFLYYVVQKYYIATSRQLKRLESASPVYSHFGESVSGASTIRAYRETERFIKESEAKVDFNQVCNYTSIVAERWLDVRLEMVGNFIILFAALFAVLNREQDAGLVGLSLSFALEITAILNQLVLSSSEVETDILSVECIKEYGETSQEAPYEIIGKPPPEDWPTTGRIEFKNFALRYRPGLDLVLKGINLLIRGGERIGIVGRTGSGKSTLTVALFRIVEAARGEILIDDINILEIGLHALRSHLTIIPQDAVLFSGSLRMNLDPHEKHSDEDIWRCLDLAQLKDFVKGLPAGLNHKVTEGGENLSVGQRQLVCLSGALLRKSKILILDEATAAIDLDTDDVIQKMLRTEFKECTVLTIAHRLNTVMDSDRILVLDKGYKVEFDSPNNLLRNKKSVFYGMAKDAGLV